MKQPDVPGSDAASRPSGTPPQSSRWAIPVSESYIVFTIWGFLFGLLFPAVNSARERQGLPPAWPWLDRLFDSLEAHGLQLLFLAIPGVVIPLVMTSGLLAVRSVLPERVRAYIPLKPHPAPPRTKPQKGDLSTGRGPGVASVALALAGSALLVFAATHVRSDRTNRRPVVTYVGPAADWVIHLAIAGWLFSLFALIAAGLSIERKGRLDALTSVGMFLAILNVFGSCLSWAILTED
jgi:hypothetical protein